MKILSAISLAIILFTIGCLPANEKVNKSQNPINQTQPPRTPPPVEPEPEDPPPSDGTSPTENTPVSQGLPAPKTGSTSGSSAVKCYDSGVADADQSIEYLSLTLKGAGTGTSAIQWSSSQHLSESGISENIFVADSRVHVRILAKEAPGRGGRCKFQTSYDRLSLKLSIGEQGSASPLQTLQFNNIRTGECSEVLKFSRIPNNGEDNPFVLQIYDVYWDADCKWDPTGTEGCDPTNPSARSNFNPVWTNHCWQIELQMATDDTKDIPR